MDDGMSFVAIHHYTRASTLPLILRNGTIRFTRADCLDDASEVPLKTAFLSAKSFFISSWTQVAQEQSGQWHRYGDAGRGIRITFGAMPFAWSTLDVSITRPRAAGTHSPVLRNGETPRTVGFNIKSVHTPYDLPTCLGNGYVLIPDYYDLRTMFGEPVRYSAEPGHEAARFAEASLLETKIQGPGSSIARVKGDAWTDQQEYRFVLMAVRGPQLDYRASPSRYENALLDLIETESAFQRGMPPPNIQHIDLPIDRGCLSSLSVTLGSAISTSDIEMILQAINEFAPAATIRRSTLNLHERH